MLYEGPCDPQVKLVIIIQKTSNNKVSGTNLALLHANSWLETQIVFLPKIIAYAIFQISLSHWFVSTETV